MSSDDQETDSQQRQRLERRELFYSGDVQGVGFRYTVRSIADGLPVTGYVENLADGRVHLIADGSPAALDQLIFAIAERMAGNIDKTDSNTQKVAPSAAEQFTDFRVRH